MKRVFFAVAAVVAIGAVATPAFADMHQVAASGLWSAYGGTGPTNVGRCTIETVGGDGRRITISQTAGQTGVDLQLTKDSWAIPANTPIDLRIQFNQDDLVPARATGADQMVTVSLTFQQSVPFMKALRADSQIRVYFPNGNEAVWTGGLSGSSKAIDAFNDCRANFGPAAPTQPYRAPAQVQQPAAPSVPTQPTQPFNTPSAADQNQNLPPVPAAPPT